MNYKLPILAVVIGFAVVIQVASSQSSQTTDSKEVASFDAAAPAGGDPDQPSQGPDGQALVAQAAQRLLVAPGLEAKTRQRVHIFGQTLIGSGEYCQLTNGPRLCMRLDLKLQMADGQRSLRQISDGNSLWEVRGEDDTQTFSYVNLGSLRDAARRTEPVVPPSYWMALGGVPRLLAKLEEHFQFQRAQPITIGGHPVWKVEGQWKPAMLARMLPDQKETILGGGEPRLEDLPEQIPHGVTLILGRDQIIPLFPYSFLFYRTVVVNEETGQVQRAALVTWELFEVRIRPDFRPSDFQFQPGDQEVQERTEQYIAQLKAAAEKMKK